MMNTQGPREKMESCLDDLQSVVDRAGLCDQVHIIAEAWPKVKFQKHLPCRPILSKIAKNQILHKLPTAGYPTKYRVR